MPVVSRLMSAPSRLMSPLSRLTARLVRAPLPRRTVRLKLTLLYGALFLLSGAALLTITYLLVLGSGGGSLSGGQPAPDGGGPRAGETDGHSAPVPPPRGHIGENTRDVLPAAAREIMELQRDAVLHDLLVQSAIALGLMSVISIALGWVVSGRILRPLRTVIGAAREISATSLHQRLALEGPSDELKELGDTFDGLLGRLETSFEAQRRFVANASHELRTPLARQRTLGQLALSDPDADVTSLRAAHERILAAGAQQERMIEALLTLARSHAGIEVRRPFDLDRLAREVVAGRRTDAEQRRVTLRRALAATVAAGHRPLAERLVINLVDNALRHNEPYGWVEVATADAPDRAVLTVANSGPVVPPSALDQLFQPFQRLGDPRTNKDGLGLGLSIVQAIAVAHDATLAVEARPEGGLVFTIGFPHPPGHRPGPPRDHRKEPPRDHRPGSPPAHRKEPPPAHGPVPPPQRRGEHR
ncbi:sensor histidine kinase [Streptomyces antioxidans]|uniref:histidine kinase n=1 Tax=Streptomyces antioxidans TaxID=1507734 RepID=A0A1V4D9B5_9ACTN|nr:HAMP domain-containing sensor histidine kinase [Streptomyces antioxidans]OPF82229.1 sensor histidine kinase [Streptomyces antioxidans]